MTKPAREGYVLTIVDCAPAGDAPAIVRLRGVLKRLLRSWNFRCTRVVATEPPKPDQPPEETSP